MKRLLLSLALLLPVATEAQQQCNPAGECFVLATQGTGAGAATNFWNFRLTNGTSFYDGLGDTTFTARFPTGSTPADNESNAVSITRIGAFMFQFDGTTWDRWQGLVKLSQSGSDNDVDVLTLPSITISTFPDDEPFNLHQWNGVVPTAAAALADNQSNPTAPAVGAHLMCWDGSTWDRCPGNSTDGQKVWQGTAAADTGPWPMKHGVVTATTAAWTSATSVDTTLSQAATGYSTCAMSLNVSGTITAGGIFLEGSDDAGTTWFSIQGARSDSAEIDARYTLATGGKVLWQIGLTTLTNIRVRLNPVIAGAGTANIRLQCGAAPIDPIDTVQVGTIPTYIAQTSQAVAASKDIMNLFNATGSGRVLRVQRIVIAGDVTAAVTGGAAFFTIDRTSTVGTTCTSVTIQKVDSKDEGLPSQVTANTTCTTDPTTAFVVMTCYASTEETAQSGLFTECYKSNANGGGEEPITLREGEGLAVKQTAFSPTAGSVRVTYFFTMTPN